MALNCAKPVHWNLMSQRICRGGRPRVREKPDPQRIAPECLYQSKFDSRPSRKSGSSFAFCREHHPGCEARLPEPQRNRSGMPLKGLMRTLSPCRDDRENLKPHGVSLEVQSWFTSLRAPPQPPLPGSGRGRTHTHVAGMPPQQLSVTGMPPKDLLKSLKCGGLDFLSEAFARTNAAMET